MGSKEQIGRNCPYCGAVITYDEYFCRACHKRLHDQQDFSAPSPLKAETFVVAIRNPWIAGSLSFISPGLGQFYNAETGKGLAFFIAFLVVSFDMIAPDILTAYHAVFFFGVWLIGIFDAFWSAWQISHFVKPCTTGASYLLYFMLALYMFVVGLHLYTGQPDTAYLAHLFPPVALVAG
jgi:TM2 domain-containing membrane protein YozV